MKSTGISDETIEILISCDSNVKYSPEKILECNFDFNQYNELIISELLTKGIISYNSILTLVIKLFNDYPSILRFYQKYFVCMIVDEYQDTNALAYKLIGYLINDKIKTIFLGDSLQRIFGFIGAVPNLFSITQQDYNLTKIQLNANYRFASNPKMLQLEADIRKNAENPLLPSVDFAATIERHVFPDQKMEAFRIVRKSIALINENPLLKIAILVNKRSKNIDCIIKEYEDKNIPYFYGLFTDQDARYIEFHRVSLHEFVELFKEKDLISKKIKISHINKIKDVYDGKIDSQVMALIDLLEIFWNKIFTEFSFLSDEEKVSLIKDVFAHNGLKQYIEFVNANIIISTVHAAKGLEWDYVILPDMEQDLFPSDKGLCKTCQCKNDCNLFEVFYLKR